MSDHNRRFGGVARLYGVRAAAHIRAAHVVVVGMGGVGSWAAEALARSGVGCLTLVDLDHVAESNINRQIHALTGTLGQAKVQAMAERIHLIHPECRVTCVEEFVDATNWPGILPNSAQVPAINAVIDACDQLHAKTALAAWALGMQQIGGQQRRQLPFFISVGAAGGKRLAHKVDVDDLAHTTHDPLLAQLRYRLRKRHGAAQGGKRMGITCVFSREAAAAPHDASSASSASSCSLPVGDGTLNCHGYGSTVAVTATFGLCASGWVLERLAAQEVSA